MGNCQFNATSAGIGDFAVASATAGHATPENSSVIDGKTYTYYAQGLDLSGAPAWEAGSGSYVISTHTLARTNIVANSNGDLFPVNFLASPIVDVFASSSSSLESISAAFNTVTIQQFTASGTYTPNPKMLYCIIECVGAGGGGGGCAVTSGNVAAAGGGGYGGYSRGVFSAATIGASKAITIGAAGSGAAAGNNVGGTGGTTSVGATLIQATGGVGGAGSAAATFVFNAGGVGGVGSLGTVNIHGAMGGPGTGGNSQGTISGTGGSGFFGVGGAPILNNTGTGNAAVDFGAGGGGASAASAAAQAGGAGAPGLVIITEFCSA